MARPKKSYKTKIVPIVFPQSVDKAMRDMLFSEERGRVPGGAISDYVISVVKRDLRRISGVNLDDLIGEGDGHI